MHPWAAAANAFGKQRAVYTHPETNSKFTPEKRAETQKGKLFSNFKPSIFRVDLLLISFKIGQHLK